MTTTKKTVSAAKPKSTKTAEKAAEAIKKLRQAVLDIPAPSPALVEMVQLDLDQIEVREQVRTEFNAETIAELASDIATRGILQPITVRRDGAGFVLVAGERRLRAARLANLATVPAIISNLNEQEHNLAQLAENIQREDLGVKDLATAVDAMFKNLGSVQDVAARVHKSKAWVSKYLSIAKNLGFHAEQLLRDGITEDIELLNSVSALEREASGSNSAWALCEKIRKGEAGRKEAREALKKAKEPKKKEAAEANRTTERKPTHPSTWMYEAIKTPGYDWLPTAAVALIRTSRFIPFGSQEQKTKQQNLDKLYFAKYDEVEKIREKLEAAIKERTQYATEMATLIRADLPGKLIFEQAYDEARKQHEEQK